MKTFLINKDVPETIYNVVSDYVFNEGNRVPVEITGDMVDVEMSDIYLEDGDVYVPVGYRRIYTGTNNTDDRDEYEPIYSEPTLTKEEVDQMVHEYPM